MMKSLLLPLAWGVSLSAFCIASPGRGESFVVVANGKAAAEIVVNDGGADELGRQLLSETGAWLADNLRQATGVVMASSAAVGTRPATVLARADQYPEVAARAKLDREHPDSFCLRHEPPHLYLLGGSETGVRHGAAALLEGLGFRWYNPMPKWHIVPRLADVSIDADVTSRPAIRYRRIYYTASFTKDPTLTAAFEQWTKANRLALESPLKVGHSYGGVVARHKKTFDEHPEYFAAGADGKPDLERKLEGRKFCTSNPDLIQLYVADRIEQWEKERAKDPTNFMISCDPSDGPGICECANCKKLGNDTDRVVSLANHTARALRAKHPEAWVGMYAYGYHLTPPTIDVEPNIYIQVAMGYNFTGVPLDQLVDAWSKKVTQIGLREYYGIIGADWGLPGRAEPTTTAYHAQWLPYYAARKVNAVNAQTDAFWGLQTLGFYTAARLMWNPAADVAAIEDDYFRNCFGPAAEAMRSLHAKFAARPDDQAESLLPLLLDLEQAYSAAKADDDVRARIVDVMAYLHYVVVFAEFTRRRPSRFLTKEYLPEDHDDAYYAELRSILEYLWQTRLRGMTDVYAFAARTCDGYPRRDNRPEFVIIRSKKNPGQKDPIWMNGEQLSDKQIVRLFQDDLQKLHRAVRSQ